MNEIRNTPLTKKELTRLYIRYLLFGCPGVDAIYIQGKSWPWWLLPFFRLYYTAGEIKENILRHFTWYNTEPMAGSLIFGIVLGMEEEKAIKRNVDPEAIIAIILSFGYTLFNKGYKLGKASLNFCSESGISDITKSIAVFGLIVVGCLAADRCKVTTALQFVNNGEAVLLQDMINKIFRTC